MITEIHAKKNIAKKRDLDKDKETISEILDKNYNEDIPKNNNDYINNINNNINKNEPEENYVFIENENVEIKFKN